MTCAGLPPRHWRARIASPVAAAMGGSAVAAALGKVLPDRSCIAPSSELENEPCSKDLSFSSESGTDTQTGSTSALRTPFRTSLRRLRQASSDRIAAAHYQLELKVVACAREKQDENCPSGAALRGRSPKAIWRYLVDHEAKFPRVDD